MRECAQAMQDGGACEIVVHARTKLGGYRPPAYWERVGDIRQVVKLPLVANGEIWTVDDALACQAASGCSSLMLGRGMVANPGLAQEILAAETALEREPHCADVRPLSTVTAQLAWTELSPMFLAFWRLVREHMEHRQQTGRLKQWLNLLQRNYPQAQVAFVAVRKFHDPMEVERWLSAHFAGLDL